MSQQSLIASARMDSELRAAIDGMPLDVQLVAQRGDWVAALIRWGGDLPAASRSAGVPQGVVADWRGEPEFDAVVVSVLRWLDGLTETTTPQRRRVSEALLDKAAEYMEDEASVTQAARLVGVSVRTLKQRALFHGRLRAAMQAAKGRRSEPGKKLTEEVADRLVALTLDSVPRAQIAVKLGVSYNTITDWQKKLGLLPAPH
ncbi:hypothetical protein ABZW50_08625 [Streptomyces bacillaris]